MPGYNSPPENILEVMRAAPPPVPYTSPHKDRLLLVQWEPRPPIDRLSRPYLKLAGLRIEPQNNGRRDTPAGYGIRPSATKYTLIDVSDGHEIPLKGFSDTPLELGAPVWRNNGKQFAFTSTTSKTVELWIGDSDTGVVSQVKGVHVNAVIGDEIQWMAESSGGGLVVKTVPANRVEPEKTPTSVTGPITQESLGEKGQSSTYEVRDTLTSVYDEELIDYHASSQLVIIKDAKIQLLGPIGMYLWLDLSPNGKHLLLSSIQQPYSYITTFDRFPRSYDIWTLEPSPVIHHLFSIPLADRVPIRGLYWVEALDKGDLKVEVEHRDKLVSWDMDTDETKEVLRTEHRLDRLFWSTEGKAFLLEVDMNKCWQRGWLFNELGGEKRLLYDMSVHERYADPGIAVGELLPNGKSVMRERNGYLWFSGTGSSPDGDHPFLDRLHLDTLKTERLFRSSKDCLESFFGFDGEGDEQFLTLKESLNDPPNVFRRSLGKGIDTEAGEAVYTSEPTSITHIADLTPIVRDIKKQLISYKRADGVSLSFTLCTPPGYESGRLPTILYAYPLDYADAKAAGQTSGSAVQYTRLQKYKYLLLAGYAIIDAAAFPIIGDPKCAYDTYLEQLVANAKAAVDEAVRLGVADPERIGVTGHSHGAFMTANLLTHAPDVFRAGVATSGAYNKVITPFGFQNERRSVWEAPELYVSVSPYFAANKMERPLLIVHGEDDANPGTTPMQSRFLYEAIRGNGGVSRLVMLPHEPHWYTSRESNEQLVYEMLSWFDKYVKGAQ